MVFQFTLRSLLGAAFFWVILLSLLHLPLQPMVDVGGVAFWMVLLAPVWVPLFFVTSDSRKHVRVYPLLALLPVSWYYVQILLFHMMRLEHMPLLWGKVAAIAGTVIAIATLTVGRCRWWYILVTPLGFAIVSGTIWIVVAVN